MADPTVLLKAVAEGDPRAAAEVLPIVYQELRRLARAQMAREHAGHTLQETALVDEACLRLVADEPVRWDNRRHFFGAAAEAMRRILVEHARHKKSLKHGGSRERVDLGEEPPQVSAPCDEV